jgi:DNA-binding NarL/FixJ family response regulator
MTLDKPRVVFFSDRGEMVKRVISRLSAQFDMIPVAGVAGVDQALEALRRIGPDFVLVDPDLSALDPQALHLWIKGDAALQHVQILVVSDDTLEF